MKSRRHAPTCRRPRRDRTREKPLVPRVFSRSRPISSKKTNRLACRAGVFLASERSDFLREMFGRHLGFFTQRKVGERNKFLPWGDTLGVVGRRDPTPTPPTLTVNQTWRLSGRSRLCPNKTPAMQATNR